MEAAYSLLKMWERGWSTCVEARATGTRSGARREGQNKERDPTEPEKEKNRRGNILREGNTARGRAPSAERAEEKGDTGGEGQPLCMRGSPPVELGPDAQDEEVEEWGLDEGDFSENLTFHEDSLSILKGTTATDLGGGVPIWVTTDSGSMTVRPALTLPRVISASELDKMGKLSDTDVAPALPQSTSTSRGNDQWGSEDTGGGATAGN